MQSLYNQIDSQKHRLNLTDKDIDIYCERRYRKTSSGALNNFELVDLISFLESLQELS